MSRERNERPSEQHIRRSRELSEALLPALRECGRRCGYAVTTHGSLERDIDLVAIPWATHAIEATDLAAQFFAVCEAVLGFATWSGNWSQGAEFDPPSGSLPNPERKPHGRLGYAILLGGGPYIDLSIMPRLETP